MKKVLFVTSRNIHTTSGELRLIKNRAEALYNNFGIATDFISIVKPERLNAQDKEEIHSGGTITPIETIYKNPTSVFGSFLKAKRLIENLLKGNEYCLVVFSGAGTHLLMKDARKTNSTIKMAIDFHGASETSTVGSEGLSIKKKIWYRSISYLDRFSLESGIRYSDICFTVSPALEKYVREKYKVPKNTKFYHIPCATTSKTLTKETYYSYRNEYQQYFGINDEVVFIYSGGVSTWQCIDETIDLYNRISSKLNSKTKLLVFSHMIDRIEEKTKGKSDIITMRFSPNELEKALCAGDYAFLLRKENVINKVAFPNKFLEYLKGGMKVITTSAVDEIARQVKQFEVGIIYNWEQEIDSIIKIIESQKCDYDLYYTRVNEVLNYNSFVSRLKPLAEELSK